MLLYGRKFPEHRQDLDQTTVTNTKLIEESELCAIVLESMIQNENYNRKVKCPVSAN